MAINERVLLMRLRIVRWDKSVCCRDGVWAEY